MLGTLIVPAGAREPRLTGCAAELSPVPWKNVAWICSVAAVGLKIETSVVQNVPSFPAP